MSKGEISESIKVYVRERPSATETDAEQAALNDTSVAVSGVKSVAPDKKSCLYYSASNKVQQSFTMDSYFGPESQQEDVYNTVAKPIVESALEGYSGTILAYGPTSSGKTFTMRGGSDDIRGIMPR
jgi:chromosomal replication initiation ATPase DnaA